MKQPSNPITRNPSANAPGAAPVPRSPGQDGHPLEHRTPIDFRVFEGPSLAAPFAAVVGEFSASFPNRLPRDGVEKLAAMILPKHLRLPWGNAESEVDFGTLAALLASAMQDLSGPNGFPMTVARVADGRWRVCLGFLHADATTAALRGGVALADQMFRRASGMASDEEKVQAWLQRLGQIMQTHQPDYQARALIRVARRRDIPVYPLVPAARQWMYGQGARALHCFETASHRDSFPGRLLSHEKTFSNELIQRLGFPGVIHETVTDVASARRAARRIGYPVVVKPPDRGKGRGIFSAISDEEQLATAFAKAKESARSGRLLVERFVEGEAHRLSVFGGKLARATELKAAHVVGDGKRTIGQLIEAENLTRSDADVAAGYLIRLTIAAPMKELLAWQGFRLRDVPPSGLKVRLRHTSNLHMGGRFREVTSAVHADNVAMAEAIAHSFHLDAIGIDFITPDIGASWRDVHCAIVEVNTTPGIGSDALAEKIMAIRFSGHNGRIPCILVVGGGAELGQAVLATVSTSGKKTGYAGEVTTLGGEHRFRGQSELPARILSLLLDPSCEALVVSCSVQEITDHGLPHTPYQFALLAGEIPHEVRKLIAGNAASIVSGVTGAQVEALSAQLREIASS
jgi:cyanophycin synthetase